MIAVSHEGRNGEFTVTNREALFSVARSQLYALSFFLPAYDVSPDGERFIMFRSAMTSPRESMVVVENFFEELKAKVGN